MPTSEIRSKLFYPLLLSVCFAAAVSSAEDLNHRLPLITAPLMEKAPQVDGAVDKGEWLRAAQGLPLIDRNAARLTDEITVYWVGYTADALYLAFRIDRPLYALAPSPEDRIEFFVQPVEGKPDYWFAVQSDGVVREGIRHATTDQGWSEPWDHKVRTTETGWEGEMRIPFKSLGLDQAPEPGAAWRLLVMENRRTPHGTLVISSWLGDGGDWPAKDKMGILRFGSAATPAVRPLSAGPINPDEAGILLETVGGVSAVKLQAKAGLYRSVRAVTAEVDDGQGGDIWIPVTAELNFFQLLDTDNLPDALKNYEAVQEFGEDFEQKPAVAQRLSWVASTEPGKYVLLYSVRDASSGQALATGTLPFEQRAAFAVEALPFLVSAGVVSVRADYQRMTAVPEGGSVVAEMKEGTDGKVLGRVEAPTDREKRRTVLALPAQELYGREVTLRTAMVDKNGKVVVEDVRPMQLPAKPEWLGWNAGPGKDEILPPWKPIVLKNDTAEIVLRQIRFGDNALPAAIRSRDKDLLKGPMSLTFDGKSPSWTRRQEEAGPARVRWVSTAKEAGVDIKVETLLEYDGMLRYDITLDPGAQPAELRNLVLQIPYSSAASLLTEDQVIKEFRNEVEMFDMDTGLQWFAEWAKGWQIGALPAFEMKKKGDTIDWTVRFIGQEGKTFKEPVTLTFGMIPTPVRELDLHTDRTFRHTHPGGGAGWDAAQATMTLSYPVDKLVVAEGGTILFRANWFKNAARLLQLGRGKDSINVYYIKGRINRYGRTLWLTRGEAQIDSNAAKGDFDRLGALDDLITPTTSWQDLALSWQRLGDKVRLELNAVEPPADQARGVVAEVPWSVWQKVLAGGEFRFGGGDTIAIDLVAVSREILPAGSLAGVFQKLPGESGPSFTLVDPLDNIRLYRGKYLSMPVKSETGRGGVAGGPWSGLFVGKVPESEGGGLLLRAGERSPAQVMKAYGMKMYMPSHEQFHHHAGFYSSEHMASPVLQDWFREEIQEEAGLGVMMYGGFGFETRDHRLAGVREELIRRPERPVFSGAMHCLATPSGDYFAWHWQRNIDYFTPLGGMYDNTAHIAECNSLEHGCGWYDDKGELQGRAPIFGARELSKRLRWLWHVYRTELLGAPGLYSLHAGARRYWAVSGFADSIKFGEGWMMGTEFTLYEPEIGWKDGWQWRVGVVGELLPKQEFQFSQNWVMLYGLLYHQPFRLYGTFLNPAWWHVNTAKPADSLKSPGAFNPYYAEKGVPNYAAPFALWWQVQDDFNTWDAEFHPFWRNGESVKLNHPKLRTSYHLHRGDRVLFVVSNFNEQPVEAQLKMELEKLGLAGQPLEAWDAFSGEVYPLKDGTVSLNIPSYQYRLVRVQKAKQ